MIEDLALAAIPVGLAVAFVWRRVATRIRLERRVAGLCGLWR